MALDNSDKKILEEIVSLKGHCLDSKRCIKCPFRAACLPEFLNPVPPSQPQRLKMALDVLAHNFLIDENMTTEEVKEEYKWDKK
jgi:hypothetical protein